jgi:hypothetical protein
VLRYQRAEFEFARLSEPIAKKPWETNLDALRANVGFQNEIEREIDAGVLRK